MTRSSPRHPFGFPERLALAGFFAWSSSHWEVPCMTSSRRTTSEGCWALLESPPIGFHLPKGTPFSRLIGMISVRLMKCKKWSGETRFMSKEFSDLGDRFFRPRLWLKDLQRVAKWLNSDWRNRGFPMSEELAKMMRQIPWILLFIPVHYEQNPKFHPNAKMPSFRLSLVIKHWFKSRYPFCAFRCMLCHQDLSGTEDLSQASQTQRHEFCQFTLSQST